MGLPAPANASAIPGRNEIVHPGYFAAYTYAAFRAGWDILGLVPQLRRRDINGDGEGGGGGGG